jgi:hypothetical protein
MIPLGFPAGKEIEHLKQGEKGKGGKGIEKPRF